MKDTMKIQAGNCVNKKFPHEEMKYRSIIAKKEGLYIKEESSPRYDCITVEKKMNNTFALPKMYVDIYFGNEKTICFHWYKKGVLFLPAIKEVKKAPKFEPYWDNEPVNDMPEPTDIRSFSNEANKRNVLNRYVVKNVKSKYKQVITHLKDKHYIEIRPIDKPIGYERTDVLRNAGASRCYMPDVTTISYWYRSLDSNATFIPYQWSKLYGNDLNAFTSNGSVFIYPKDVMDDIMEEVFSPSETAPEHILASKEGKESIKELKEMLEALILNQIKMKQDIGKLIKKNEELTKKVNQMEK